MKYSSVTHRRQLWWARRPASTRPSRLPGSSGASTVSVVRNHVLNADPTASRLYAAACPPPVESHLLVDGVLLLEGYAQEAKPPFPRGWDTRASASWDAPQRSISPGGGVSGARGFGVEANGAASLDAVPPLARPQPFLPPHLRHSSGSTDAALDALGGAQRSLHGWRGREWGGEPPSDRGAHVLSPSFPCSSKQLAGLHRGTSPPILSCMQAQT